MILEYLEPYIEKRVIEVGEEIEENTEEMYIVLMNYLKIISEDLEDSNFHIIGKIENLFIQRVGIASNFSYKKGFNEGMGIGLKLK